MFECFYPFFTHTTTCNPGIFKRYGKKFRLNKILHDVSILLIRQGLSTNTTYHH